MVVVMDRVAAGPEWVLDMGRAYDLPVPLARQFLAAEQTDGVTGDVVKVKPAAHIPTDAERKHPRFKVLKPARPDPEDHPEALAEEDDSDE